MPWSESDFCHPREKLRYRTKDRALWQPAHYLPRETNSADCATKFSHTLTNFVAALYFYYTYATMQCVILAAGQGVRLRPLTENCPKPLVKVLGVPLLDHIVAALPSVVDSLVIVVGYRAEQIRTHCGAKYFGRPVTYVRQTEQNGTIPALWLCSNVLRGRSLYMFGDNIHGSADLAKVTTRKRALLTHPTTTPEQFGMIATHSDGTLACIVEKPQSNAPSNLAATGVYVFDDQIFNYAPTADVISQYAKQYPITVIKQEQWFPVGYPKDITDAEAWLTRISSRKHDG